VSVDKGKPQVSGQHALAVPKVSSGHGSETEGGDDILDVVVRTATKKSSDQQPRDRQRARNVDRKSCEFNSQFIRPFSHDCGTVPCMCVRRLTICCHNISSTSMSSCCDISGRATSLQG